MNHGPYRTNAEPPTKEPPYKAGVLFGIALIIVACVGAWYYSKQQECHETVSRLNTRAEPYMCPNGFLTLERDRYDAIVHCVCTDPMQHSDAGVARGDR